MSANADLIKRARETYKRYYPSGDCNEDEFLYRMNELADALERTDTALRAELMDYGASVRQCPEILEKMVQDRLEKEKQS